MWHLKVLINRNHIFFCQPIRLPLLQSNEKGKWDIASLARILVYLGQETFFEILMKKKSKSKLFIFHGSNIWRQLNDIHFLRVTITENWRFFFVHSFVRLTKTIKTTIQTRTSCVSGPFQMDVAAARAYFKERKIGAVSSCTTASRWWRRMQSIWHLWCRNKRRHGKSCVFPSAFSTTTIKFHRQLNLFVEKCDLNGAKEATKICTLKQL